VKPAAFLDRDGVLNVDHGYVYKPEDWEWNEDAVDAIRRLNGTGYLVVVVTNQSGVGRGFYSEEDVRALHAYVQADLAERGGRIDAFYYCPHAPKAACECRKPLPGMLLQAVQDLDIDRSRSFLIGDKESDLQAAEAANIRAELYQGGSLLQVVEALLTGS
jgi:D-glycero-D-manno-heptose 1,7-bisphosphate phosphatase